MLVLSVLVGCTDRHDAMIPCARGTAPLAATCSIDRLEERRGLMLIIRNADGGFRRLLVTRDGHEVIAADGAEPARVTAVGRDAIDVAIGGDRYRLPATVRR